MKAQLSELTTRVQKWHDEDTLVLRRLETSLTAISKSIGTLSGALNQLQLDVFKSGGSSESIENTVTKLRGELARLETVLKEHTSGHIGVLSESLVGRGGFWKGIWMVVGVQAAGWVIYEYYRSKKDNGKKFL